MCWINHKNSYYSTINKTKVNQETNKYDLKNIQDEDLEGKSFDFRVSHTFVNGNLVYKNGNLIEIENGQALTFDN